MPIEDGECLTCHQPHHSEQTLLLTDAVPDVCLTCHDGDDPAFTAKHLGLAGSQMDCRKCHDPHVSPQDGLINKNSHDPFSAGACDACHENNASREGGDK